MAAAGAVVVGSASQRRKRPDPASYFGTGRAAELADERAATGFNLLIVDDELAPNQQRALEKLLDCKVLDRSALIIDIFARHATTREGRLQVELAALEYHLPRLTRLWTHLSRTGGGIGTRGPGESQLETDRRLIRDKIRKVRSELEDVKRQRATAARQRERSEVATVALVGYTNAGKSTLLNRLATADLFVEHREVLDLRQQLVWRRDRADLVDQHVDRPPSRREALELAFGEHQRFGSDSETVTLVDRRGDDQVDRSELVLEQDEYDAAGRTRALSGNNHAADLDPAPVIERSEVSTRHAPRR